MNFVQTLNKPELSNSVTYIYIDMTNNAQTFVVKINKLFKHS